MTRFPPGIPMIRTVFAALLLCATAGCEPARSAPPQEAEAGAVAPHPGGPAVLTAEGWGPLRIGMTRAEVVAAAGEDANPEAVGGPEPEVCDELRPREAPAGMRVMLEQGRLTRISVARNAEVRTPEGFGVGSPAAEIRTAYGARAEATPHKYLDAPAEYLTVWTVAAEGPAARGIVYEIGTDGRAAQVHAGSSSIRYVEGCL